MNKEFEIKNNMTFEDEETKIEYQKYLDKINEYNRKVQNGEKPDFDLSEVLKEFNEKFEFEGYEPKQLESYDIDKLLERINNSLDSKYSSDNAEETLEKIDARIKELEELEND